MGLANSAPLPFAFAHLTAARCNRSTACSTQSLARRHGVMGESQRSFIALQLAQAIGIERMGQEDADADEGKKRCYDLDHSFPPRVEMPGRARLRNSR